MGSVYAKSVSVYAYLLAVTSDTLELYCSVDLSEQSIIGTTSNVFTCVDMSTSLANEDIAGNYCLTVSSLDTKSLGLGITAVLGRTHTFFVSEIL